MPILDDVPLEETMLKEESAYATLPSHSDSISSAAPLQQQTPWMTANLPNNHNYESMPIEDQGYMQLQPEPEDIMPTSNIYGANPLATVVTTPTATANASVTPESRGDNPLYGVAYRKVGHQYEQCDVPESSMQGTNQYNVLAPNHHSNTPGMSKGRYDMLHSPSGSGGGATTSSNPYNMLSTTQPPQQPQMNENGYNMLHAPGSGAYDVLSPHAHQVDQPSSNTTPGAVAGLNANGYDMLHAISGNGANSYHVLSRVSPHHQSNTAQPQAQSPAGQNAKGYDMLSLPSPSLADTDSGTLVQKARAPYIPYLNQSSSTDANPFYEQTQHPMNATSSGHTFSSGSGSTTVGQLQEPTQHQLQLQRGQQQQRYDEDASQTPQSDLATDTSNSMLEHNYETIYAGAGLGQVQKSVPIENGYQMHNVQSPWPAPGSVSGNIGETPM